MLTINDGVEAVPPEEVRTEVTCRICLESVVGDIDACCKCSAVYHKRCTVPKPRGNT